MSPVDAVAFAIEQAEGERDKHLRFAEIYGKRGKPEPEQVAYAEVWQARIDGLRAALVIVSGHRLACTTGHSERLHAHCECGWQSPVVADQRTAHQAHDAHAREAGPTQ